MSSTHVIYLHHFHAAFPCSRTITVATEVTPLCTEKPKKRMRHWCKAVRGQGKEGNGMPTLQNEFMPNMFLTSVFCII